MTGTTRTRRAYNGEQLTAAIKTILSPTHPLTRSEISLRLGPCVSSLRIWQTLNNLVETGEVLKFSGHPNTFIRKTDDDSIYFSIRGRPRAKG